MNEAGVWTLFGRCVNWKAWSSSPSSKQLGSKLTHKHMNSWVPLCFSINLTVSPSHFQSPNENQMPKMNKSKRIRIHELSNNETPLIHFDSTLSLSFRMSNANHEPKRNKSWYKLNHHTEILCNLISTFIFIFIELQNPTPKSIRN